ncbi:uncharacterized protein BJ212DRAFT_1301494 [Suillus subaureus]|uniref:Uncharacterized protein n=1 Tax=Suillus subaureus TaxID=48587 RepID=A0A9P7E687_9AGAM|nr:uncharacterized protein BJ212DRAFT_1301494 [Suillus subaureus]KAG1812505.1 hypothetical protein BJ212DRAFT_1301494 [Suillus subaureus]
MLLVIKIACVTIRWSMGVSLLTICSEEHVSYKAAYFKMLLLIRQRRSSFPVYIDNRVGALLAYTIERDMVLRAEGIDPRARLGIEELLVARRGPVKTAAPVSAVSSARGPSTGSSKMPDERRLGASIPPKAVSGLMATTLNHNLFVMNVETNIIPGSEISSIKD